MLSVKPRPLEMELIVKNGGKPLPVEPMHNCPTCGFMTLDRTEFPWPNQCWKCRLPRVTPQAHGD